jgi:pimeloyl-ACP methyl ester carboxylesterase
MATFVLVHGAWGGGWQWQGVADILRAGGHEVTTPTLAGLGERAHLSCDDITLLTHIDDLVEHLWFEDLTDAVLVGWSYGAVPVEGAADRVPERLRMVVSLDGVRVRDGAPGLDNWPPEWVEEAVSTGWISPPTADDLADVLFDPALREFVAARERRFPIATLTTPFPDSGGRRWHVRHAYLACMQIASGDPSAEEQLAWWGTVKTDPRWDYRELPLNHLGLLYAADVVATALLDAL